MMKWLYYEIYLNLSFKHENVFRAMLPVLANLMKNAAYLNLSKE